MFSQARSRSSRRKRKRSPSPRSRCCQHRNLLRVRVTTHTRSITRICKRKRKQAAQPRSRTRRARKTLLSHFCLMRRITQGSAGREDPWTVRMERRNGAWLTSYVCPPNRPSFVAPLITPLITKHPFHPDLEAAIEDLKVAISKGAPFVLKFTLICAPNNLGQKTGNRRASFRWLFGRCLGLSRSRQSD